MAWNGKSHAPTRGDLSAGIYPLRLIVSRSHRWPVRGSFLIRENISEDNEETVSKRGADIPVCLISAGLKACPT